VPGLGANGEDPTTTTTTTTTLSVLQQIQPIPRRDAQSPRIHSLLSCPSHGVTTVNIDGSIAFVPSFVITAETIYLEVWQCSTWEKEDSHVKLSNETCATTDRGPDYF
jgi:hypothetical protein